MSHSVLVLGNYRQSLAVVRSLARAGYRVIVGFDGVGSAAERSRYADEVWRYPAIGRLSGEEFARRVSAFMASRRELQIVFPVGDGEIVPLSRHRNVLPAQVTLVAPSAGVVEDCLSKQKSLELAAAAGFPVAPYRTIAGSRELAESCAAIGYPVVVRPLNELTRLWGRKALILDDASQLAAAQRDTERFDEPLIVQRQVQGPRQNIYFAARQGELLASLQVEILRTDRPDGTGYATEGVSVAPSPALVEACRRLVGKLAYTGIGCVQVLADRSGETGTFLEINSRLGANGAFACHCGLDLPRLAVELARGEFPAVPATEGLATGRRYAWTYGDLMGLREAVGAGEIGVCQATAWLARTVATAARCDSHVTWTWSDPRPTVTLFARAISAPLRKLFGRKRGRVAEADQGKCPAACR